MPESYKVITTSFRDDAYDDNDPEYIRRVGPEYIDWIKGQIAENGNFLTGNKTNTGSPTSKKLSQVLSIKSQFQKSPKNHLPIRNVTLKAIDINGNDLGWTELYFWKCSGSPEVLDEGLIWDVSHFWLPVYGIEGENISTESGNRLYDFIITVEYYPYMYAKYEADYTASTKLPTQVAGQFNSATSDLNFYTYPDCKHYSSVGFYDSNGVDFQHTLKESTEYWKKAVESTKYGYKSEELNPVLPGYNPRFAKCLLKASSTNYTRGEDEFEKVFKIFCTNTELSINFKEMSGSDTVADQLFAYETDCFVDAVIPHRLLVVAQAGGGGGGGGARGGGGSGAAAVFVLNLDLCRNNSNYFLISSGKHGKYGNVNSGGGRASDCIVTYVYYNSDGEHRAKIATIPGGRYITGGSEPSFVEVTSEDLTQIWKLWAGSGRNGGEGGDQGPEKGADILAVSAYSTTVELCKFGTNKRTFSTHSGGNYVDMSTHNKAGGGAASYFADGANGSGGNAPNGVDGSGGGGATWTKDGGAGGSSVVEFWY